MSNEEMRTILEQLREVIANEVERKFMPICVCERCDNLAEGSLVKRILRQIKDED